MLFLVVGSCLSHCDDGIPAIGASASNDEHKDRAQRHPKADERGDARHALHTQELSRVLLANDRWERLRLGNGGGDDLTDIQKIWCKTNNI